MRASAIAFLSAVVVVVVGLAAMSVVLPLYPFQVYRPERATVDHASFGQVWKTPPAGPGESQITGATFLNGSLAHAETRFDGGDVTGSIHRQNPADGTDLGVLVSVAGRSFGQLAAAPGGLLVASRTDERNTGAQHYLSSYTPDGRRTWDVPTPGDTFTTNAAPPSNRRRSSEGAPSDGRWSGEGTPSDGRSSSAATGVAGETPDGRSSGLGTPDGRLSSLATAPDGRSSSAATGAAGEMSGGDPADLVVAYGAGGVAAYGVWDGSARWSTPSPAVSAVIVSGAVVTTDGTTMSGFDAQTGTREWSGTFAGDEVVAAGEDVVAVGPDAICSFVARTGVEKWCGGPALSAVADGSTLYAVGDGTLTAISLATGDTRWGRSFANGWAVSTSLWRPVVADGTVYAVGYHFDGAGGQRHELFAVRAVDGGEPHQVPFDLDAERGGEPLVAAGGQVYFAGLNAVYAFGAPAL